MKKVFFSLLLPFHSFDRYIYMNENDETKSKKKILFLKYPYIAHVWNFVIYILQQTNALSINLTHRQRFWFDFPLAYTFRFIFFLCVLLYIGFSIHRLKSWTHGLSNQKMWNRNKIFIIIFQKKKNKSNG